MASMSPAASRFATTGSLAERVERYEKIRKLYYMRPKNVGFADTVRCAELESGLDLWSEYVLQANEEVEGLGPRALSVRFEQLLRDPERELTKVIDFLDLDVGAERLAAVARRVRPVRAFAHRNEPRLQELAWRRRETLTAAGYGAAISRVIE